ncbi:hypothetical protein NUW58_g307 [Xylaria curta]|uniref:Uncharacterized protein n=1 Tax=Xylaria curta TaxID=42375 RepID=A0ACC1PT46_9PEZI|nr:hypothetical protein NUW58_g307 [Xylaria curta]
MTSTLPQHLFDDLGDLRENNKHAEKAPSYRRDHLLKFNINFNAAIVVLRHLYSHVNIKCRFNEVIEKEERSHPILRLIWAGFEDDSATVAQSILRHEMQHLDDPRGQITVSDMFERPAMYNTLWHREPFLLYHPSLLGRPRGAKEWRIIKDGETVAKDSLVWWDSDNNLGDYIGSMFGRRAHKVTGDEFVDSFNDPAVIRVRYEHTAKDKPPVTYQYLRQIQIPPRRLGPSPDDPSVLVRLPLEKDKERSLYTLVAVVRCSGKVDESDRIRLYKVIGHRLSLSIKLKEYVGTYWNLGDVNDPGRVYLLFYAISGSMMMGVWRCYCSLGHYTQSPRFA